MAAPKSVPRWVARLAVVPVPESAAMRSNASSTSVRVSCGDGAGAGRSRKVAQPTPVRRCRNSPDKYARCDLDFVSTGGAQRAADEADLLRARGRCSDGVGDGDEIGEQHAPILACSTDRRREPNLRRCAVASTTLRLRTVGQWVG